MVSNYIPVSTMIQKSKRKHSRPMKFHSKLFFSAVDFLLVFFFPPPLFVVREKQQTNQTLELLNQNSSFPKHKTEITRLVRWNRTKPKTGSMPDPFSIPFPKHFLRIETSRAHFPRFSTDSPRFRDCNLKVFPKTNKNGSVDIGNDHKLTWVLVWLLKFQTTWQIAAMDPPSTRLRASAFCVSVHRLFVSCVQRADRVFAFQTLILTKQWQTQTETATNGVRRHFLPRQRLQNLFSWVIPMKRVFDSHKLRTLSGHSKSGSRKFGVTCISSVYRCLEGCSTPSLAWKGWWRGWSTRQRVQFARHRLQSSKLTKRRACELLKFGNADWATNLDSTKCFSPHSLCWLLKLCQHPETDSEQSDETHTHHRAMLKSIHFLHIHG